MQNMTDDQIRKTVKSWLKENRQTQAELAEKIGIKYQSFRAQMSTTKISAQTKLALMNILPTLSYPLPSLSNLDNRDKMELRLDYESRLKAEKEALRLGMELSTYCTLAVEWASEQKNIGERLAARLANQQQENTSQNHGTGKQEIAKQSLPSHTESTDPASRKRTTGETLGILRLGTNPDAKRKSGSA